MKIRIAKRNTGRCGQCTAVGNVHTVDIQIVIDAAEAANTGNQSNIMLVPTLLSKAGGNGLENDAVTAACAPSMGELIKKHIILISSHDHFSSS